MKPSAKPLSFPRRPACHRWSPGGLLALLALLALLPLHAHASMFKGEALDAAADVLAWVVLVIAPVVGIGVFLMVHILPEKVAEKNHHPQTKAIQCLCLLSLFFGGMLWPLAWLWAYSRPVLHQLAYGTDKVVPEHKDAVPAPGGGETEELRKLRQRVDELEARLAGTSTANAGNV